MHFDWLVEPSSVDKSAIGRTLTHVRDEVSFEWVPLGCELDMYCVRGQTGAAPLDVHVARDSGAPRLVLVVPLDMRLGVGIPGVDGPRNSARGSHFWCLPAEPGIDYHVDENTEIVTVGFNIMPEFLARAAPEHDLFAPIRMLRERGAHDPFFAERQSDPTLRAAVAQLVNNPYRGHVGQLYAEGKALEIIAIALDGMGAPSSNQPLRLNDWERHRIREAKERLIQTLQAPPSSSELARAVGLPSSRLERGFREMFGTSIFQWLQNYKLDLSRELLLKEPLSIKEIAFRLGYAHSTNFTHAFRRRFGEPPAAIRRR